MKSDEKRAHRLNYLLRVAPSCLNELELFLKAKQMGVSDSTARDYVNTVLVQLNKSKKNTFRHDDDD